MKIASYLHRLKNISAIVMWLSKNSWIRKNWNTILIESSVGLGGLCREHVRFAEIGERAKDRTIVTPGSAH
ncbi:MAG: hypothetical protein AAFY26_26545, partial [Cyanobacteria bacterium J06638_22]